MIKIRKYIVGVSLAAAVTAGIAYAATQTATEAPVLTASEQSAFTIPGTLDLANTGSIEVNKLRNSGTELSYVENGGTILFKNANVTKAGEYKVVFPIDYSYGDGTLKIEVTDLASNAVEANYDGVLPKNNSKFEKIEFPLVGKITEGAKNVKFTFGRPSGFVCNAKSPEFVWVSDGNSDIPTGWMTVPGELDMRKWNYNTEGHGKFGFESDDKGVGYVKNKAVANVNFYNTEDGVYSMSWRWKRNQGGDVRIVVKDLATDAVEIDQNWTVADGTSDILLEGLLTKGRKNISLSLTSGHDGWIGNYFSPVLTKVGNAFASVKNVSVAGADAAEAEGFDWAFNLPMNYSKENVEVAIESQGGAITVKNGETEISGNNGVYSVPTPAANAETVLDIALAPESGAYSTKTEYKVRLFRIGDIVMTGVALDGMELGEETVAALNADNAASFDKFVFTATPKLTATFIDGTTAEGTCEKTEGTKATYKLTAKAGSLSKEYTLTVDGLHLYNRVDSDKDAKIVYDGNCKKEDGSWSNGLFTINPCGDGWGGTQFKFRGNKITLTAPGDMVVKQLVLAQLFDNYVDGKIKSITSEGATVWMPTASSFKKGGENAYNLVVNVENHKAGTPFVIEIEGGSQPVMWFEFVYAEQAFTTPVALTGTSCTSLEGRNHAVVTFSFDRAVANNEVEVDFYGKKVKATGGSTSLKFPLWDLDWQTDYTLTVPANTVKDKDGNSNTEALTYSFTTGVEPVAEAIAEDRFIEVSTVEELRAAVASLASTNNKADSPRTVIFIKNGDYDLGNPSDQKIACLAVGKGIYNVSFIGESQSGVLIHGTRTGISYPVFSTRDASDIYMENFTLRNDFDFGKTKVGVAVAHYGGKLDIMKNVTLQSQQDTQVTGERGYYLNCTFHGTVDYICGDGDHFYDHCTFVQESAGAISAPSTSPSNLYGYVFSNCTIKGASGYTLGRPWQGEPRAFWLNTTMEAKCADGGWAGMGNLTTHFFEYGSKDADGNLLDLSKRKNSESSVNHYNPILDAKYLPYFTPENVLGREDSWLAREYTSEIGSVESLSIEGTTLKWAPAAGAVAYIVYADGEYHGMTLTTSYDTAAKAEVAARSASNPVYTVAAVNKFGARGTVSAGVTTGVNEIGAESSVAAEYYNLQGIRVSSDARGALIRVTVDANGKRVATKVINK